MRFQEAAEKLFLGSYGMNHAGEALLKCEKMFVCT